MSTLCVPNTREMLISPLADKAKRFSEKARGYAVLTRLLTDAKLTSEEEDAVLQVFQGIGIYSDNPR